ncbi:MAG: c-type cytochrome [Methyloceanibacter sp.]|uniref:c-type cytochrome n=1 Tax=Methyloceanibacter sp. TaxID=1965321 RepID=UPI003D9BD0FA
MLRVVAAILIVFVVVTGIWSFWETNDETATPVTETDAIAAVETEAAPAAPPIAEPSTAAAPAPAPATADTTPAPAGQTAAPAPADDKAATPPADDKAAGGEAAPAAGGASADEGGNPQQTAEKAEKGSLKNPNSDPKAVGEAGHKIYMSAGCNGCHGGTGGGGMGPPLTNPIWVYGKDDDTLFRLIALGSDGLKAQGYARKGSENVVGPMPPHGGIVKSNGDMWKIISWMRTINPSSGS